MDVVAQEARGIRQEEVTTVEDVVVEGRPLREAASAFVGSVAAPAGRLTNELSRWHQRVCVGVVNIEPEIAQALIDRVSTVAGEIGLQAGAPRCRPGVLVVVVANGDEAAREMVASRPRQFRPQISGSTVSKAALDRFQTSGRPIRWWHISQPVDPETGVPVQRVPGERARGDEIPGNGIGRTTTPFAASRLRDTTRADLRQVIVIVEIDLLVETPLPTVADFIAMVGLAQIDDEADTTGFDTILNLLNAPDRTPPGVTDWDLAYLRGLYATEQAGVSIGSNLSDVADLMTKDLRERSAEPCRRR